MHVSGAIISECNCIIVRSGSFISRLAAIHVRECQPARHSSELVPLGDPQEDHRGEAHDRQEGREGEWQEDGGGHEEGGEGHFRPEEAQRRVGGYLRQEGHAPHGGDEERAPECERSTSLKFRTSKFA